MKKKIKFYDTSAILVKEKFNPEKELYVLSVITLQELENLKTSNTSNENTKYQVRRFLRYYEEHPDEFEIHCNYNEDLKTNDEKILSAVYNYVLGMRQDGNYEDFYFVTNDLAMKALAEHKWLKRQFAYIISEKPEVENYTGYLDIVMDENTMSNFYSNLDKNTCGLLINQYVNIYNTENQCVDSLVWTGEYHRPVKFIECNSVAFGKIKPKDMYQRLALDSFKYNTMTYISGPPGSGKTMLALAYLFQELEKGHIDRIVVFCNPVPARNSAKLGLRI